MLICFALLFEKERILEGIMEISSSVMQQQQQKQHGGWLGFGGRRRYRAGPMEYRDKGHIGYYSMKKKDGIECCLSLMEKKKKTKKWLLEDVVVAEEKQRKMMRKQAKRMMKMNIVDESSESSESSSSSSDSECSYVVRSKAKKKTRRRVQEEGETESILAKLALTLPLTMEQQPQEEGEEEESILAKLALTMPLQQPQEGAKELALTMPLQQPQEEAQKEETAKVTGVKVCMGNKCKKMGAEALMADWQARLGDPAAVIPCKCMGKCKSAPNVTLFHHSIDQPPLLLPA